MYKERETKLCLIFKETLEYEKKANEIDRQIVEKIDNVSVLKKPSNKY